MKDYRESFHEMNRKSAFAANGLLLLAAVVLLVTPTVYSCVNFIVVEDSDGGAGNPADTGMTGNLTDNGSQTCWIDDGMPESDGLYHFTCIADFTAIWTPAGTGTVQYTTPNVNVIFDVPYYLDDGYWAVCVYNCEGNECFLNP